jgi:exodeoxyribonuclease-3
VDAFREIDQREEQYTWWSNRGRTWDNNTGWRIDYQVTTPGIAATATVAEIYKQERFSDHAPLILDYTFDISNRGSGV